MKIVFVHLGDGRADHLWANINSLIARFESIEIALVSDRQRSELITHPRVSTFQYVRPETTEELMGNLKFERDFRNGFWHFSLERLIALGQYHLANKDQSILHIESDVLLLNGFPAKAFNGLEKLTWLRAHETGDIATLIYSPNAEETHWLAQQVESLIRGGDHLLTDMTALLKIRVANPNRVATAPSLSKKMVSTLSKDSKLTLELTTDLSEMYSAFEGIFDPAAIGMWLTGCDPRNHYGFTRIFDTKEVLKTRPFLDPSQFDYKIDASGRLIVLVDDSEITIWCLHVHSKNLELFNMGWEVKLQKLVQMSNRNRIVLRFDLKCLIKLIISNLKNKTFVGFILHIPKLRPLREFLIHYRSKIKSLRK
jgi:hypothetical protein